MLIVLSFVTVAFTIPAETGNDPTGIGSALRLDELGAPQEPEPEALAPSPTNVTELLEFAYSWTTSTALFHEEDGELAEGERVTIGFDIDAQNVTRVTAVLSWQDSAAVGDPQPDTFRMQLVGPTGENETAGANYGASGELTATVAGVAPPADGNVSAANRDDAMQRLQSIHPANTNSSGAWHLTIELTDVADLAGDDGNAWSLDVFVETYAVQLGEAVGSPIREATIPITVPAFGDWVEYKVFIAEGAELEYDWSASGELRYDFHGRRSSGQESSHATGDSDGESGTLLVPFNGQHGWAFLNNGATDVEVTLTIRGPFVLPG